MKNQPYNVLRHIQRDRAPKDPVTLFNFAVGTLGFSTTGAVIFAAVATIGISVVTSSVLRALAPKPNFGSLSSQGILVNSREPDAPHQFVYGEVRKGGTITYLEATGEDNKFLHMIIALAGHECEEIGDIYIDDNVVTLDVDGFVTDAFLKEDDSPTIRVQKFDGSQTAAPADLLSESELTGADALDANFIGNGIAYLYVRLEFDQNAFPNGIPLFTARVKGKKVYDPRTDTTAWSDNSALCIRDYITSDYGLDDPNVDDVSFSAAANICDEAVPLSGLGEVSKYTSNGIVLSNRSHGEVLDEMVTSCGGTLFWGAGEWKLTVADYIAPTKTLTLDDLRSSISLQTRNNLRDQFNIVQGTFINKDARWITNDYPAIVGTSFITEDGGIEQPLDLQLPFTTDSPTAQRLAKLTLYRGREQITFTAEFGMNAFDVEVGEIIELDIDRYGWSGKEFEVIGWQLKPNQDAGDLRVALTLRETSAAAFSWDAEESEIIDNDTNLPDPSAGLTISNLTASGGGRTQGDGTFINSAILNWDDVANAFLDYYEVEWKPLADSVYSATTTEQSDIELSPLIDGVEYIFRVRAVTVGGIKGPYTTVQFTGGGDETGPSLPTSVTPEGGFEYIRLTWVNPTDADFSYVEVWESEDTSFSNADKIAIATGNTFVRTNLGINVTRHYWLRAFDYSGNGSEDGSGNPIYTARAQATTDFVDSTGFVNDVVSLFADQGLYPIKDVTGLPVSGDYAGQKVFNRTDGILYEWSGSAWVKVIAEPDTFIASDKIVANTITGGLLATSGIITDSAQINNAVIENANIANLAVDTIKVANDAITRHEYVNYSLLSTSSQTYNFSVDMDFAGQLSVIGFVVSFGSGTSTSITFTSTIDFPAGFNTAINGYTASGAGQGLGDHTLTNSIEVTDLQTGTYDVETVVTTTGITSPQQELTLLILKRYK